MPGVGDVDGSGGRATSPALGGSGGGGGRGVGGMLLLLLRLLVLCGYCKKIK